MARQLALIDTLPEWRIDPRTRQIGLQGIARARAVLAAATGSQARSTLPPAKQRTERQHRAA